MNLVNRLARLLPDLAHTIARFPVPVVASVALCLYSNLEIAEVIQQEPDEKFRVTAALAATFFASGAVHLYAEATRAGNNAGLALALIAGAAAAMVGYSTPGFRTYELFLFPALILLIMIAPFLGSGARQPAIWLFNLRLGLAALLAVVVGVVFAAGLSAIIESLNFLFEIRLPNDLHEHIWTTAATLVAPIYGIALVPKSFDEEVDIADERGSLLERGVSVLVNYLLVPMVAVYALILHAYAIKVIVDGALPRGQVGTLVAGFALAGTGAWLVAWPWRDTGTRLLRWFMAGWFWLTIVPAILLAVAVWRRISDYGVTPQRYGLVIIGVWLAGLAIYLATWNRRADMRHILGSLAVLLLIGSFGPWGAVAVSVSDQFARLTALTESAKMLEGGRLVQPIPHPPESVAQQASSIILMLSETGGLDRLKPWFEGRTDDPFRSKPTSFELARKIIGVMGLPLNPVGPDAISFASTAPLNLLNSGSVRIVGPLRLPSQDRSSSVEQTGFSARIAGSVLELRIGDRRWEYPVRGMLEKAKEAQAETSSGPVVIEAAPDLSILLLHASGTLGDVPNLGYAEIWLIQKQ
jgi:hypothetical protein